VLTREPGGTAFGQRIRALVLDPQPGEDVDIRAEALLMAADRAQHVASVVRPALESGRDVVTDRYAGSSLAYQGYGRGLDASELRDLSDWASDGLWPDLVIVLDVSPEVAQARLAAAGERPDRLEAAGAEFHQRVADGFRQLAVSDSTWRVVDATRPVDQVTASVDDLIEQFFAV
jgi:dTMP kinase